MCDLFGAKKAAKKQAKATLAAAQDQARSDAFSAQAAAQTQQVEVAAATASKQAGDLLNRPMESVDVNLAPVAPDSAVDSTGRRRTTRSQFMSSPASSGLNI